MSFDSIPHIRSLVINHTGAIEHGDYEDDVDSDYDDVDDEEDDAEDDKDDDFELISANELDEQPVRQVTSEKIF